MVGEPFRCLGTDAGQPAEFFDKLVQLLKAALTIPYNRDADRDIFTNRCRVDINMDDFRLGCEGIGFAGRATILRLYRFPRSSETFIIDACRVPPGLPPVFGVGRCGPHLHVY